MKEWECKCLGGWDLIGKKCDGCIKNEAQKKEQEGWITEKVKCSVCGKLWVAVYPDDHDKYHGLECPQCGHMSGNPSF